MLARRHHRAVRRPPHRPAQRAQPLPDLHNLALDQHLGARRRGAQKRRVERAAHAQVRPVAGLGDEGERGGGGEVEEG